MDQLIIKFMVIFFCFTFQPNILSGQMFTKVIDGNNPVITDPPSSGYTGASWIDFDNDGDLDLFVNAALLYENSGGGNFFRTNMSGITGVATTIGNGNSWGDFDNDGFIDVALANGNSAIYRNLGNGTFEKIDLGVSTINAWASNWVDYDNDGDLDVFFTHPCCTFIGAPVHSNRMFQNNGDGTFSEISGIEPTTGNAAYTVSNWSDFDNDGDMDLFIGSGEVGFASKDHIYINKLSETGSSTLERWSGVPIADDLRDGQNWNWIDYDNDSDLDGFVTNYKNDVKNDFYRNDNGIYTKLTMVDLGADMVSANGLWLSNFWGDFDNDGDLDVVIINDNGTDRFYLNNGDGTFTSAQDAFTFSGSTRGGTAGDMDNDGDLDIFINSPNANARGLYRNTGNDNHWFNLRCEGTITNRSAIGAKVRLKANINGKPVWQMRELSSQSSFCGMNSLRVHFGLANAQLIDSLIVEWPLSQRMVFTNINTDQFCTLTEGQGMDCTINTSTKEQNSDDLLLNIFPNPGKQDNIEIIYNIPGSAVVKLSVSDSNGQIHIAMQYEHILAEKGQLDLDLSGLESGMYYLKLESARFQVIRSFVLAR